jgi:hypothetical protein
MQDYIAVDGTFSKTFYKYVFFLATGVDTDDHTLVLAWAYILKESASTWSWFFNLLKDAISCITEGTVIVSHRQKGLMVGFEASFD